MHGKKWRCIEHTPRKGKTIRLKSETFTEGKCVRYCATALMMMMMMMMMKMKMMIMMMICVFSLIKADTFRIYIILLLKNCRASSILSEETKGW